jgi:hypothetical protein
VRIRRRCRDEEPDWDPLAVFNAERSRGIVHTPEYVAAMEVEQRRFDEWDTQRRPQILAESHRRTRSRWIRRHPVKYLRGGRVQFRQVGGPPPQEPPSGGPGAAGDREPRNPLPSGSPMRAVATPNGDSAQEIA